MDYHQLSKVMPLIAAIQDRNFPGIQVALDNGADINFRIAFDENKTPLHHAVTVGDPGIVDLLLTKGADPSAKNKDGKMPIELILDNNRKSEIEEVFKKHGCDLLKSSPSLNSTPSAPASTYNKRKGTTSIRGQLYETKLLALVLFRALHRDDITAFNLATNVDDAGAFDDIVMRYTINGTDKCIYLQAKHKDGKQTNFKDMIDSNSDKGDFSLLKYFNSYLALKVKTQSNTSPADTEFIIFTNIGINFKIPGDVDLIFHDTIVDRNHLFYSSCKGRNIYLKGSLKMLNEAAVKWYYNFMADILANQFMQSNSATCVKDFITLFLESFDGNKNSLDLLISCNALPKHEISRINRDQFNEIKLEILQLLLKKTFSRVEFSDADCCSLVTDFFASLILFTSQATEQEVEKKLKSEIASIYPQSGDINLLYHLYHNGVQHWWLQTGKVSYQTKDSKLFANARSDIQRNSWLKNLHEISMNKLKMFNVEFCLNKIDHEFKEQIDNFMKNDCSIMFVISKNQLLSSLKLLQYITSKSYEFNYIDSNVMDVADFSFKLATDVSCLILSSKEQVDDTIIQTLQTYVRKICVVSEICPRESINCINDMNNGLVNLTAKSQAEILNSRVIFQGNSVCLRILLDENLDLVNEQILHKLLMGNVLEVVPDSQSEGHDNEMNYYVDRTLTRCFLNSEILKDDSFIVVDRRKGFEFPDNDRDIIVVGMATSVTNFNINIIDRWKFEDAQSYFDHISRKHHERNIHLLQWVVPDMKQMNLLNLISLNEYMQNPLLQWERSHNSIKKIYKYSYQGPVKIEPKSLTDIDKSLIILAADPGMGKSTYLTALSAKTKQNNPYVWIIRINLLDFSKIFNEWQKKNVSIDKSVAFSFLENALFNKSFGSEEQTFSFGKNIFSKYCELKKPILLMDGFDEISPDYKETVLSLIKVFKDNFISSMWITTRPIQKDLELHFTTFSYFLQSFNDNDCIDFLRRFWRTRFKVDCLDEKIFITLATDFYNSPLIEEIRENNLIRVPLYLKMIATICESNLQTIIKDSNNKIEFYIERFDLLILYEKMVEMTFVSLHSEKNKSDITKPSVRPFLETSYALFLREHKILAMHRLFNEEDLKWILSEHECSTLVGLLEDFHDKTGIILGVIDWVPVFVHQTYAEYFCACFIFEKYASLEFKSEDFKKLVNTFFIDRFSRYGSSRIIQFTKLIIEKRKAEIKSKYAKAKLLMHHLINNRVNGGTNSIKYLFFHLIENSIDENYKNSFFTTDFLNSTESMKIALFGVICEFGCIKLSKLLIEFARLRLECFIYLQVAVLNGHTDIVTLLLENRCHNFISQQYFGRFRLNGKQLNIDFGTTALHLAVLAGHIEIVKILLLNGAKVNITSFKGYTPLMEAVSHFNLGAVKLLLEYGAETNICSEDLRLSPLHVAAFFGYFEITKLLIRSGAQVNASTSVGETPLLQPSGRGHRDVVELLLDNGAWVNSATTDHGLTALFMAAQYGQTEIVTLLLARGAEVDLALKNELKTPLFQASAFGKKDVVEILLKNGANCNAASSTGVTPLHTATYYCFVEVVLLLLNNGALVNTASLDHYTPLHEAAQYGHTTMAKLLVEYGAHVNVCTTDNLTPLHLASCFGHSRMVTFLLENGADINASFDERCLMTPLYLAAIKGHLDVVNLLIENGAYVRFCINTSWKLIDTILPIIEDTADIHSC